MWRWIAIALVVAQPALGQGANADNGALIDLHGAGLGDDVLIARIEAGGCRYRTQDADLLAFKSAGLSDRVIAAVLRRCSGGEVAIPVRILPNLSQTVGLAQAGTLCFPSGTLHLRDFVPSEASLTGQVRKAFDRSAPVSMVTLVSVEGKLCARGYGIYGRGDRKSMSGHARFVFRVTNPSGHDSDEVADITADKDRPLTTQEITEAALAQLAGRIGATRR